MTKFKNKFTIISFSIVTALVILSTLTNYGWQKAVEKERLNTIYMPLVSNIFEVFIENKNQTMKISSENMFTEFNELISKLDKENNRDEDILNALSVTLAHSSAGYVYYISMIGIPARYYCYTDLCAKEELDFSKPFDAWFNAFVDKGEAHSIAVATTPHKDKKLMFNNFLFKEGSNSTFAAFGTGIELSSPVLHDVVSNDDLPVHINIMNESGELIFRSNPTNASDSELGIIREHIKTHWTSSKGLASDSYIYESDNILLASKYLFDISTTGVLRQHWYLVVSLDTQKLLANSNNVFIVNAIIGIAYLLIFYSTVGKEFQRYDVKMRKEALIDKLTGKPNRKMLSLSFDTIVDKVNRRESLYAFVILDLDKFKPVNDTYGHLVGDQVLIEFSNRLTSVLSGDDVVGRLGGDEFVCLINVTKESAEEKMVRMHNIIENEPFEMDNGPSLNIHFSFGFEDINPNDDFDDVYQRADINLYKHKKERKE